MRNKQLNLIDYITGGVFLLVAIALAAYGCCFIDALSFTINQHIAGAGPDNFILTVVLIAAIIAVSLVGASIIAYFGIKIILHKT